jgi:flagellar biosynthetic protein FliP
MQERVAADAAEVMIELAQDRVDAAGRMPLSVLLPAYMITEIERGFQFGFLVFLPFLVIDIVVASILMSMGMMMLPPVVIALPFKLAFFTVSDGWSLIAGAMVRSYAN